MALRPPRAGFSVARRMSERARAAEPQSTQDSGGLSGLMDALRNMAERLATAAKDAGEHAHEGRRTINLSSGDSKIVFGYSIRMGEDGPAAEPFGDIPRRDNATHSTPEARQPITDVFTEEHEIVVVAELPGADSSTIKCQVEGKTLLIESNGQRRYRKEIALPASVEHGNVRKTFQNGILEVRLVREAGQ